MRRLSFAWLAAVCSIGLVPFASAADLPVKAPVMAAPYNWTGFYAGLNAGGGWGRSVSSSIPTGTGYLSAVDVVAIAAAGPSFDSSGFTGGVQAGYNWQTGSMVVGLESDFQYFHMTGSGSSTRVYPDFAPVTFTSTSSISTDWLWTIRPRVGWAMDKFLFYVTGGLAVTKLNGSWAFIDSFAPATESASASGTKAGWTVGGGVEAAVWSRWTVKAEYLYADFGSVSATSTNFASGGFPIPTRIFNQSVNLRTSIARVGLNYRF